VSPQLRESIRMAQRVQPPGPFLVVGRDGLMAGIVDWWTGEDGRVWWRGACAECVWETARSVPFRVKAEVALLDHVEAKHGGVA
jgi:hypothetical protein